MRTRYLKQRVWLMETSCDTALDCVIESAFSDGGQTFYRCKIDGEAEPFDLAVTNIIWIRPQTAKVVKFPTEKKLAVAK